MTRAQMRLLNSLCGDLSKQVAFNAHGKYVNAAEAPGGFGTRLHKDDWRHALAGKAKGQAERYIPDWDDPEKKITPGTSSLRMTVEEADFAIEMAYALGANCDVRWTLLDSDGNDYSAAQYEQESA